MSHSATTGYARHRLALDPYAPFPFDRYPMVAIDCSRGTWTPPSFAVGAIGLGRGRLCLAHAGGSPTVAGVFRA